MKIYLPFEVVKHLRGDRVKAEGGVKTDKVKAHYDLVKRLERKMGRGN